MSNLQSRPAIRALSHQQIREVANAAMGATDVLAFWFGESHLPTPEPVREAGAAALMRGETFYVPNLGLPELRHDIAAYLSRWHRPIAADRIAVTSSGLSALMITLQALVSPGDSVVIVTPVWPNMCEMPRILGAEVVEVPLEFGPNGWALDLDRLIETIGPRVRAVLINSPGNPTGWTLSRAEQAAILAHCRAVGAWLIADDVYERLYFQAPSAPSFLDIVDPSDRFITCNSFSKAWRMTGWRIGWAVLPEPLVADYSKLIEYNTSCVPGFVQSAARVALSDCEADISQMVDGIKANQQRLYERLASVDCVELGAPARGGMYAFFRIKGLNDSLSFCKQLAATAKVGLAPGSAFSADRRDFVRWCIATDAAKLNAGLDRFEAYLATRPVTINGQTCAQPRRAP